MQTAPCNPAGHAGAAWACLEGLSLFLRVAFNFQIEAAQFLFYRKENNQGVALCKRFLFLRPEPFRGLLPTFPSKWWAKLVVRLFSLSLNVWEESGKVFAAALIWEYFLQGFRLHSSLLCLIHLRGGEGGKKRRSSTGILWRVCLYRALVFLSSWNSHYMILVFWANC